MKRCICRHRTFQDVQQKVRAQFPCAMPILDFNTTRNVKSFNRSANESRPPLGPLFRDLASKGSQSSVQVHPSNSVFVSEISVIVTLNSFSSKRHKYVTVANII